MQTIKALLFDLDGTLIDSEFFHFECWNEVLEEFGVKLTYADWLKNYAGVPLPVNAKNLIGKYNIVTPIDSIILRRENLTLERLRTKDVNLMPFVKEFLEFVKAKNLKMALVTSSPRKDVEAIFERNELGRYFDLIITRTDVTKSKPDPESYNLCREQLGCLANECLVFEDTINGAKAAKAAGLTCYAIQSNQDEHDKLKIADQLFLDLNAAKEYLVNQGIIK